MDQHQVTQAQWRIEREYLEMPGLSLTEPQTRRLLGLPSDLCEAALKGLARHGFLVETAGGTFLRRSLPSSGTGRRAARRPLPGRINAALFLPLALGVVEVDRVRGEHALAHLGIGFPPATHQPPHDLVQAIRRCGVRDVEAHLQRCPPPPCAGGPASRQLRVALEERLLGFDGGVGRRSGVVVKLARMSVAMRSNSERVGSPSISSIVLTMLCWA